MLSTFAIAKMLHVDPGSVANWIDQDMLKAHRTPGGHRRVRAEDLVEFLREHKMAIPEELDVCPPRVLVVDDQPAITRLIRRAIESAHPEYEVCEAHDGFRAGTVVASLKPDVVILDLRMPGMDGFEVCRTIRQQSNGNRKPEILAVTAYPSPENEEKIRRCGARVCLSKPLDMDTLLAEVDATLSDAGRI